MSEVNTDQLKRYTGIDLPNREKLERVIKLTELLFKIGKQGSILFGVAAGILYLFWLFASASSYYVDLTNLLTPLTVVTVALVASLITLVAWSIMEGQNYQAKYDKYFGTVYQGRVKARATIGGGYSPLLWVVALEGYTLANELTTSWEDISAGEWADTKVGDYIEINSPEKLQ